MPTDTANSDLAYAGAFHGHVVEMLEPFDGRVYDPCCGPGGMFFQSEQFVAAHGGNCVGFLAADGDFFRNTWLLAHMNLANNPYCWRIISST